MRTTLIVPTLIVLALVSMKAVEGIDAVTDAYLKIQAGLAVDSIDGVKANATTVADAAAGLGPSGQPIVAAANEVAAAATLKAARAAFGKLSSSLVKYFESTATKPGADVKLVYCPMVKQPWLQRGGKIANPYFGKLMPGCGEFRTLGK